MKEKRKITVRRWLWMFMIILLILFLCVPTLNLLVDPYGAFGDPVLHWWSYDMTLNPRLAKVNYLAQHSEDYDSFILGPSGSSSIPVEELNGYLDARFYNLMFYDTENESFEKLAVYLLDTYAPKNLVLNLSLMTATSFSSSENGLTEYESWRVTKENRIGFYLKYLFANPKDSLQKLQYLRSDGYLQTAYKVFDPETGAYDRSLRDVEPIGDLEEYLSRVDYQAFRTDPSRSYSVPYLEQTMGAVARIKRLCAQTGTRLFVFCQPTYQDYLACFSQEDQTAFFNALAQITDYWDFTLTSVSSDPRYFYDATHFRNAVGTMMLARMFGNDSVYIPDDFGRHVVQGSKPGAPACETREESSYTAHVPILRYHHLTEGKAENPDTVTRTSFEAQMNALHDAGYTPVSIWDLRDYVELGIELPEKPIMITFDDGYESNYSLAFPVLRKFHFKATIFAIGISIGKDTYKDTGEAMAPHFSLEQAKKMTDSGLITVASHGYNVHEVTGRDTEPIRRGVMQRDNETEEDYVSFLTDDALHMQSLLGEAGGFFAYPYDIHDSRSLVILNRAGVYATVSGDARYTTVIKGLPQSLYNMHRSFVGDDVTGPELISMLESP
ncbi:MAG: polysaccharide deacetylase family protein [Clostridia bacterium]|nr:polysaccharide deacetylase family protein [Clostridia bacterium]